MSASAKTPRTAAADRASLGAVLGERTTWIFFALGFGTGIPLGWSWIELFPRSDIAIDRTLFLVATSLGVVLLIQFIAAPFLDRYRAPFFRALGHRRSWVASSAAAALVLIAVQAAVTLASGGAAIRYAAFSGLLAFPVLALLWISIDALRIDAQRGRAQAAAYAAQFSGALAATLIISRFAGDQVTLPLTLAFAALMAIAFGAVLTIKEPPRAAEELKARAPVPATLVRPWRAFFGRHGTASGPLLGAIAAYAVAASAAGFLGKLGYLIDIFVSAGPNYDLGSLGASASLSTQEIGLMLIGAVAGLLIAFRLSPARAFIVLTCAWLAVVALFVLCAAELGFTVFTVAGLFALRSVIAGAAFVIFWSVAARLTAPPHTAGQFAMLSFLLGLFWINDGVFRLISAVGGGYGVVAAAVAASAAAILFMRLAVRRARRAGN